MEPIADVEPIAEGSAAPPLPGAGGGPRAVVFYKVTCPTCQIAAPAMERLHRAAPDGFTAVVQDPPEAAQAFAQSYDTSFDPVSDPEPYELSNAYGIRTVPTLFVLDEGRVREVVESWDREGWNRAARVLEEVAGVEVGAVSEEGDGLPPFRPG